MITLTDFKNSIGNRFKVVDGDGKPFHGLLGEHLKATNSSHIFQTADLLKSNLRHSNQSLLKSTHMDPNTKSAQAEQQEEETKETSAELNTDTGNDSETSDDDLEGDENNGEGD